MWAVIDRKYKFYIAFTPAIIFYVIYSEFMGLSFLRSVSYTFTTLTFLAFIVGKFLWKYIYIDFFKTHICPNLNGNWNGIITSNFDTGTKVEVPVKIAADFFNIKMYIKTTVGYSHASYCRIIKLEDGNYELQYIFKAVNYIVAATDVDYYDGAARVSIDITSPNIMHGVFWTNRNWRQKGNTAGQIVIEKSLN